MKPIPVGFCEAADNALIPGRPWWRLGNGVYVRRDGGFAVFPGVPAWMGADVEASHRVDSRNVFVEPSKEYVLAAVERIDAEHPLPHPGYRAGQVWLVGITTWICTEAWEEDAKRRVLPHNIIPFNSTTRAFLLHDPLMPSKAPWSPQ